MALRVLVVDNYDSFVYNLVQAIGTLGAEPVVFRNDQIDIAGVKAVAADAIVISPGPGRPEDGGISLEIVAKMAGHVPILGVCLGHQCIGQAFGGSIVRLPTVMHGKTSAVSHDSAGVFSGLPDPLVATRYHSLVIDRETLPGELVVTAWCDDGTIMGVRHRALPVEGVQFHPESILTPDGPRLLANFLEMAALPGSGGIP
jgi:anthranilate synthase/aminodeoxychorismate synthase-like glutamine amidotransferase